MKYFKELYFPPGTLRSTIQFIQFRYCHGKFDLLFISRHGWLFVLFFPVGRAATIILIISVFQGQVILI